MQCTRRSKVTRAGKSANARRSTTRDMYAQRGEGGWNNGSKFNGIWNQQGVMTYPCILVVNGLHCHYSRRSLK